MQQIPHRTLNNHLMAETTLLCDWQFALTFILENYGYKIVKRYS